MMHRYLFYLYYSLMFFTLLHFHNNSLVYGQSDSASPLIITEVELWGPEIPIEQLDWGCVGAKALAPTAIQWVEIHNTRDEIITTANGYNLTVTKSAIMTSSLDLTLGADEYCIIPIPTETSPIGTDGTPVGIVNSTAILTYFIRTGEELLRYEYSTPEFSDLSTDNRTWQLNGTEWIFVKATPSKIIPEFPISILIASLAIGGTLAIIRLRKSSNLYLD